MANFLPFAHRKNSDRSIDSICTACYQTIASEDSEDKLTAREERHTRDRYWQDSRILFDTRLKTPERASATRLG
jgi:hypothetical protein